MKNFKDIFNKHCTKSAFYAIEEPKGITLIVLIITITVMLILAGVAIANLTGGDGVMEQAQEKKDKTKIASEEAILGNVAIEATDKNGEITEANLRSALSKNNVEITPSGGLYRIVFKDSNNLYKMNHQGEFFYWEDMAPTDIYAKKDGTTLYLRSTQQVGYTKGTYWMDNQITKVVIEEPIAPSGCAAMFANCTSLKEFENIENLHTENSNDMSLMFRGCNNLEKIDLRNFDTSNVTTMYGMFSRCKKLEHLNFSSFDTSKVTTFDSMFYECNGLIELNLNGFNTSNCTNMYEMFTNCNSLRNLDVSSFNTSKVTTMNKTFRGCTNLLSLNVTNFDTSNVTDMYGLFAKCSSLSSLNVSNFNTSNVTNMESVFDNCNSLKSLELTNFNTSNVLNMKDMFINCENIKNLDLSSFNTKKVDNFDRMFYGCTNLKTIYVLTSFETSQATNIGYMFNGCINLIGGSGTTYTSSYTSRAYSKIDGGPSNPGFFTLKEN